MTLPRVAFTQGMVSLRVAALNHDHSEAIQIVTDPAVGVVYMTRCFNCDGSDACLPSHPLLPR